MKIGQVHKIISSKFEGVEQHMAHFSIIRNYMKAEANADAWGS